MRRMFFGCSSLLDLKFSNFKDTINMAEMFYHCTEKLINKLTENKNIKGEAFINGKYYIS